MREAFAQEYRVIDIDGARVYFDTSDWALIRASNTSPKLSLRLRARRGARGAMKELVREELTKHLPGLKPF